MEVLGDNDSQDYNSSLINENTKATTYKWNQSKTLQLIEIYKEYPELYNSNCVDYRNKYKRKIAISNVAQQMDTTIEIIKKKIHALRTMYTTELKKMKKKNSTQPSWVLFDAVNFLYDEAYYKPPPRYNVSDVQTEPNKHYDLEDIIEYVLEDEDNETLDIVIDEDGESSLTNAQIQFETYAITTAEQQQTCQNCKSHDEFTSFGEKVASELRLIKDHEVISNLLKRQILKVIEEAKELITELSD